MEWLELLGRGGHNYLSQARRGEGGAVEKERGRDPEGTGGGVCLHTMPFLI